MPKVDDAHFEARRKEILDAAKRVCETKPVYQVTMKEIVIESGMSQGGVYRYFPNIDSVFAALLNEAALGRRIREDVDGIVSADASPGRKLQSLLDYLGSYVEEIVNGNGSVSLELIELFAREPERFARIRDRLLEVNVLEYLLEQLRLVVLDGVASKSFEPVVELHDLFDFLHASIHGITHAIALSHQRTEIQPLDRSADLRARFGVLSRAMAMLLGEVP